MQSEDKVITLRDGTKMHATIKEKGAPVWMVAIHGLSEHLGRHSYIQDLFGHDFNVCQYDLRGHGKSEGPRAYIEDFSEYIHDLQELLQYLRENYKMERFVLIGHSMGGLIVSSFLQNSAEQTCYPERVLINAPPVGYCGLLGQLVNNIPREMMDAISRFPYGLQLGGMVNVNFLSHDPHVKQEYNQDKLNTQKVHSRLLLEIVRTSKEVYSRPIRPLCPSFCTFGGGDRVVSSHAIREYFQNTEKSFSLKEFEGAYHEIQNEIEKYRKPYFDYLKEVFNDVLYSV